MSGEAGGKAMSVKSGLEIVKLHEEYAAKLHELENAMTRLGEYSYTKGLLQTQIIALRDEMLALETTRFQPLDPVTVSTSSLGGHDFFVS